jgi:hypothetical protein
LSWRVVQRDEWVQRVDDRVDCTEDHITCLDQFEEEVALDEGRNLEM